MGVPTGMFLGPNSGKSTVYARPAKKNVTATGNITPAASAAFQKAIAMYGPGGGFGKGVEAQLERGRTRSTASGMNTLIGSGLAGDRKSVV